MSLMKSVVHRPTTIGIIFILLIGFGLYTISDIAVDLYPEIDPPVLLLFTNNPGSGPAEIEQRITRVLESALSNVGSVERISSTSSTGSSMIIMEFTYGTDMADASNDVRDRLDFVRSFLPDTATTPQIFKFDPSMIPIMMLAVRGDRSPEELRVIAENAIQPRIEQVEGVALASVSGGREQAIMVEIPQNRLEAYNLSLTQIANLLRAQNLQVSAGMIARGSQNLLLNTAGEFENVEQIKDTVISYAQGSPTSMGRPGGIQPVRLRDIANVYDGYKPEESNIYINGQPGVYITVQKQSGTNSVAAADRLMERLQQLNEELPYGIEIEIIMDTTEIIRTSLRQVAMTAITGAILAVIILLIFLRSFKSTLIIGLSIPISIIVTLTFMYFSGLTLNIMTLAGLALGIGMLVDNSIVILENIFRYREKGTKLKPSAIVGSQEMITAISASTLTTICVFLPVAVFQSQLEMLGELFAGLSFTVVISLLSSLAVAIFLIPVLASHYLPIRSNKQQPKTGISKKMDSFLGKRFSSLDNAYKRALTRVLKHRALTIIVVVVIFAGSLFMIPLTGFELMPEMEDDMITLDVTLPLGTRLDVTREVMSQLELIVQDEVPFARTTVATSGEAGFMGFLGGVDPHRGSILIVLPEYSQRTKPASAVKEALRGYFHSFPDASFEFGQTMGGGGGGGGSAFNIGVKSQDLDRAKETATRILALIEEQIPEVTESSLSLTEGLPQLDLVIDRERAYSLGLNVASIGQELRANIDGIAAGNFVTGGLEKDIVVILDPRDRSDLPDLNRIFVMNSMGQRIPVSSFARLEEGTGPVSIARENQIRIVRVRGGLAPGANLQEVDNQIRSLVSAEIPLDEDLIIEFGGDFADLIKYGMRFAVILLISIFLVFGVMASQFESFLDPFIIFFSIPLLLIGIIWLYVATATNFSVFTLVGIVLLVGIVVNNGIVLVDYTNLLRKRGLSITEACIEAGGNRLRPILMTSLTTILGLLPMAFLGGEGADLVQPIGRTVVGGLTVSTVITLFLVPVIYSIFNNWSDTAKTRKELRRRKRRELARLEAARALHPEGGAQ